MSLSVSFSDTAKDPKRVKKNFFLFYSNNSGFLNDAKIMDNLPTLP